MTKYEWESELRRNIIALPPDELKRIFEYYDELFADKAESGKSETQIVSEFGNPADVARKLLSEYFSSNDSDCAEQTEAPVKAVQTETPAKAEIPVQTETPAQAEEAKQTEASVKADGEAKPIAKPEKKGGVSAGETVAFVLVLVLFGFACVGLLFAMWSVATSIIASGVFMILGGTVQAFAGIPVFAESFGAGLAQIGISVCAIGLGIVIAANIRGIIKLAVKGTKGLYHLFIGWYVKKARGKGEEAR